MYYKITVRIICGTGNDFISLHFLKTEKFKSLNSKKLTSIYKNRLWKLLKT